MKLYTRLLVVSLFLVFGFHLGSRDKIGKSYLEIALEAERWIQTATISLPVGKAWHPHPDVRGFLGDNLDFEKEIKERDRMSWSGYQKNGVFGCDAAVSRSGKQSGFLKSHHEDGHSGLYQTLYQGVDSRGKVILKGYHKSKDLKGMIQVYLRVFGGNALALQKVHFKTNGKSQEEWIHFNLEAEVPRGCDRVSVYLLLTGKGQVWFDDLSINFVKDNLTAIKEFVPSYSTVYNGTPGVILFYLELYHVTGNEDFLKQAISGGDYLISHILKKRKLQYGLYIGTGGFLFILERLLKITGNQEYKSTIDGLLSHLQTMTNKEKEVIVYPIDEILYGGAGDGLALLHLYRELKLVKARDIAIKIGDGMVYSNLEKMKTMPNFSHGISGVGYFLACLYKASKDMRYLKKVQEIADYLVGISEENCLIYHDTEHKDLFYLGYCHGPVGTARFYFRLWQITGEQKWWERMLRSADSIIQSGIPQIYTPGYWNNLGKCCGHAGVAEFFLGLYKISKKEKYLKFAKLLTDDLISKATKTSTGAIKWVHAEHNRQREFTMAQTGLMQGSAGIGLWLLHLEVFMKAKKPFIIMPDYPFFDIKK
jgi:rhamnogalacturonyl hydrolase YesR